MSLRLEVFAQMIIGLILMIFTLVASLKITYSYSYSLIDQLSDSMYEHQQNQLSTLLMLYSQEFSYVFQRHSENLQAMNRFRSNVLQNKVNFDSRFVQLIGNREKMFLGTESEPIQSIFNHDHQKVNGWFNKDTLEFDELDEQTKIQMRDSERSSILQRIFMNTKNVKDQEKRKIYAQGTIDAQSHSGSIYVPSHNASLALFHPNPACPYQGKYHFDPRCRVWYLQASKQHRVTPIEPSLIYSETIPILGLNICKSGRKYLQDGSGAMVKTNCTYSVNCITFRLTEIKDYFETANYNLSKTIMIDPRSQILVYNQLNISDKNISFLSNASAQLFPNDANTQELFVQQVMSKINKNKNPKYESERLMIDETDSCEFNPFKIEKLLNLKPVNFGQSAFEVPKINLKKDKIIQKSQSFILLPGEKEEVFVALNCINIIEKLYHKPFQKSYEIQDLFIAINVLPRSLLTSQSDKLKEKINLYITWVSITSMIICILLIITTGIISFQVAVMIEKPLIHMTVLLKKLDQEGRTAAIDLIDEQINYNDSIFLSKDSEILYNSFRRIFQMLHLATEDIFAVEDSCSLLRLNYQINFFKEFNNLRVLGICYNNMGNIHFENGRYFESMEAYQNAIILAQQEGGLYQEQQENEELNLSKEQNVERGEITENKKQEKGVNLSLEFDKQSNQFASTNIFSKVRAYFNLKQTNYLTQKRITEQMSIDNHFSNLRESSLKEQSLDMTMSNQRKYQHVQEEIKEIIFDRKLNFSYALYMHNITQERDGYVIGSNISSKVLNNPINHNKNQCFDNCVSSNKTMFEWENYEKILLDLIEINQKLIANSFGRTVILLTQLSLCHLKMGKVQQAVDEQSLAIDHYHFAMTLESLRKNKNSPDKFQPLQNLLNVNMNTSMIASKIQVSKNYLMDPTKDNTQLSPKQNTQRDELLLTEDSEIAVSVKVPKEQNWMYENQKSNLDMNMNEDYLLSTFRKRQLTTKQRNEQTSFQNNSNIQNSFNQQSQAFNQDIYLLKTMQKDVTGIEIEDEVEEIKEEMIKDQNVDMKVSVNYSFGKQLSFRQNTENNETEQNKVDEKFLFEQMTQRSALQQSIIKPRKSLLTYEEKVQNKLSHKFPMQSTMSQSDSKYSRSKLRKHCLNSKVNKQFEQEDFDQISRYEMPSDILLYYVTLQESRLLLFEKKEVQSAFILTNLLENSKYYLPYYRLACLNVLSGITNTNQQIQSEINKLMRRFDLDIQFNATIAVVLNSNKQDAINTILNLISEVFTKDEDIISLLLYEENNFQWILSSIMLKQLRLTDGYLESFLEQIPFKKSESKQFPIIKGRCNAPSLFKELHKNQRQLTSENVEDFTPNFSKDKSNKDFQMNVSKEKYKQKTEGHMTEIALKQKLEQGERDSLLLTSPLPKKHSLREEISLLTMKRKFSSFKERMKELKYQTLIFEESEDMNKLQNDINEIECIITSSRNNHIKKEMKGGEYTTQIDSLNSLPCSKSSDYLCAKIPNDSKDTVLSSFHASQRNELLDIQQSSSKSSPQYNLNTSDEIPNHLNQYYNPETCKMNLIFHLTARQCLLNFFNQDSNKYKMYQKQTQQGIFSKQKKFVILITDSFGIIINQAYSILSTILYSTQTQLLILLLNKEEQFKEGYSFSDVEINGKSVIKYFYTQEYLLQYIRNKREPMKNFGVPLLVEHLNM